MLMNEYKPEFLFRKSSDSENAKFRTIFKSEGPLLKSVTTMQLRFEIWFETIYEIHDTSCVLQAIRDFKLVQ